jgi:hypothetical protein
VSRSISGLLGVGYTLVLDSQNFALEGGYDAATSFNSMLNMGIQKSLSLDSARLDPRCKLRCCCYCCCCSLTEFIQLVSSSQLCMSVFNVILLGGFE